MPETDMVGNYMGEMIVGETTYYQVLSDNYVHQIPIDRTLEVNEIL